MYNYLPPDLPPTRDERGLAYVLGLSILIWMLIIWLVFG